MPIVLIWPWGPLLLTTTPLCAARTPDRSAAPESTISFCVMTVTKLGVSSTDDSIRSP